MRETTQRKYTDTGGFRVIATELSCAEGVIGRRERVDLPKKPLQEGGQVTTLPKLSWSYGARGSINFEAPTQNGVFFLFG